MAVVSGIANVITAALGWRAQDVDACLSAISAQLGGVSWVSGWPFAQPGNLDSANFASGIRMGPSYIQKNKHLRALSFQTDFSPYAGMPPSLVFTASSDITVTKVAISFTGASGGGDISGTVPIYVNDVLVTTVTIPTTTIGTARSGVTPVVFLHGCNFRLSAGAKLEVKAYYAMTGTATGMYDRQIMLIGYGDNTP
jgi:hypothetical protein